MSHTPGPWKIDRKHHLEVYAEPDTTHIVPTLIALALHMDYPYSVAKANARLIAAAPALLAALKGLADEYSALAVRVFQSPFNLQARKGERLVIQRVNDALHDAEERPRPSPPAPRGRTGVVRSRLEWADERQP